MLDHLIQDLRYAARTLRTSPGFAAVAILSLALGIGANTAIFSLIDAVMLQYLPVSHPEELLQVLMGDNGASFTNPLWEQVRDRQDVFSGVFAYSGGRFNLTPSGEARYAQSTWASGDFFATLGVRAVLGRTFTPADDRRGCPGTAVLSYDFWQREYNGSAAVTEKAILLDGHPFQILGVVQPGFHGVDVGRSLDVMVPICTEPILHPRSQLDQRSSWWLRVVGRPKTGLGPGQVTARLKTLSPDIFGATVPPGWRADDQASYRKRTFITLPAANGLSYLRTQYRPALITLLVVVAVVLLIACANVANLLLARAAARQREIAIRLALGLSRARLIRQLLTESLLLALAGAVLGMLFAQWGSRLLVGYLSSSNNLVYLDLSVNGHVLGFTIAVAATTGLLFGLAPAWRGTRVEPQAAMKENGRGVVEGSTRFGLGKVLVMVQVALSLLLLVGAGLLLGTFRRLETLDPGFEPSHVLIVSLDLRNAHYPTERLLDARQEMLERLRAIPGVRSASSSNNTPISGSSWNDSIQVEGYTAKSQTDSLVWMYQVSPRYFETLGTPLIAGRDFDSRDKLGAPKVAIVSRNMAKKFFGATNPVGKTYRDTYPKLGPPVEIIGVVGDTKYRNLREEAPATVYLAAGQEEQPYPGATFELRCAGSAADLIPSVKTVLEQINSDITLQFRTLSEQVAASLTRERLLATLSGFFGALALLLATIGLYGVMSYNVARRRSEIGIRMALGAAETRVLRMVLGEVSLLVGVGLLAGLGAAIAATRLIETFVWGVTVRDPVTLAMAAVMLGAVALLAGYLPARRASRLDPMAALREE
ncbi:MAG TPA: ABC transporter permease [Bryobacteraceae bacterium]|nr:ABC transporter permease [Bryobacteraceae bacterium]